MNTTYKSAATKLTTANVTTLYTVPSSTSALVKSCYCSNSGSAGGSVDVFITKNGSDVYLIKGGLVPIQATLQPITEPIILETGDVFKVKASSANLIDTILSYVELT